MPELPAVGGAVVVGVGARGVGPAADLDGRGDTVAVGVGRAAGDRAAVAGRHDAAGRAGARGRRLHGRAAASDEGQRDALAGGEHGRRAAGEEPGPAGHQHRGRGRPASGRRGLRGVGHDQALRPRRVALGPGIEAQDPLVERGEAAPDHQAAGGDAEGGGDPGASATLGAEIIGSGERGGMLVRSASAGPVLIDHPSRFGMRRSGSPPSAPTTPLSAGGERGRRPCRPRWRGRRGGRCRARASP